jgi:hypothetical protein
MDLCDVELRLMPTTGLVVFVKGSELFNTNFVTASVGQPAMISLSCKFACLLLSFSVLPFTFLVLSFLLFCTIDDGSALSLFINDVFVGGRTVTSGPLPSLFSLNTSSLVIGTRRRAHFHMSFHNDSETSPTGFNSYYHHDVSFSYLPDLSTSTIGPLWGRVHAVSVFDQVLTYKQIRVLFAQEKPHYEIPIPAVLVFLVLSYLSPRRFFFPSRFIVLFFFCVSTTRGDLR